MKWSNSFLKTVKDIKGETKSHELLLRAGLIHKMSPGIFTYHSILLKTIQNLENIIREELSKIGYEEILMPMVQPKSLWDETGRWDKMGESLLKFKNRNDQDFCLAGTHEEAVSDLVRSNVKSYKNLPVKLYQIQTKFRDELRPRYGLIRGKEFIMKDAYSFAKNEAEAMSIYEAMIEAYNNIFTKLGLKYVAVSADAGSIGGKLTHEFQLLSDIGDDELLVCECKYTANKEVVAGSDCPKCGRAINWQRGIELGHCFLLGTEYSEKMNVSFMNDQGKLAFMEMGCYGIGVSRIVQAMFEQASDSKGMIFPEAISPYKVHLVNLSTKDEEVKAYTQDIYNQLTKAGVSVFWDDRDASAGAKLNDMDLLGFPYQIITSAKMKDNKNCEFSKRTDSVRQIISTQDIIKNLK